MPIDLSSNSQRPHAPAPIAAIERAAGREPVSQLGGVSRPASVQHLDLCRLAAEIASDEAPLNAGEQYEALVLVSGRAFLRTGEGEAEIEYLRTVLYEVESAPGEMALNEIRAELKSQGYLKYYKQRDRKQKPADFLRYTSSDGFEILVGRNNLQNDKLTLHTARGKDLWFHVQKAPGSHCVVMSRGEDIPDTTKQEAAELAVLHSSQNGGAKVAVDTTEVKNIWKANGAKPGMVLYEVYTTVYVTPREGLEEQLKKR